MIFTFVLLFILAILLAYSEDYLGKYNRNLTIIFCCVLILIACLRPVGFDPDSESYQTFFDMLDTESDIIIEYSFVLLGFIVKTIYNDIHLLFFMYATIGITLKFIAIKRLTGFYFLSLVIYLSSYFIVHDYIQMRASVASALLLFSIIPLSEGKKIKTSILYILASFFHLSAVALFPILFFNNKPLTRVSKFVLVSIVITCLIMFVLHIDVSNIVSLIPIGSDKLERYQTLSEYGVDAPISLNNILILKILLLCYLIYFYDTVNAHYRYLSITLKIYVLSFVYLFAFSSIAVLSVRLFELIGIVEIILFPMLYYTMRPSIVGKALVCLIGAIELFYTVNVFQT